MEFSIQDFIQIGMLRDISALVYKEPLGSLQLNLGAGEKPIPGTVPLDITSWNADTDPLPFDDEQVDGIWALHFLEHLERPIEMLKECQRVLAPGGFCNIVVPYYTSNLHHSDLDHKHTFTENTFRKLFRQKKYYSKGQENWDWNFYLDFNLIIGVEEKNLALYVQLIKGENSDRTKKKNKHI